ncbi:MAG: GTPase HflX [Acidobacteriota bacterium]|jgi:GTP-binding protein HflX
MNETPIRCFLIAHQGPREPQDPIEDHLVELHQLALSCGLHVVGQKRLKRPKISSQTFYGPGQIEELTLEARAAGARILICDDELSGSQSVAIERLSKMICMDRTRLILKIFEQRAKTKEAKAQVELARLQYELPRLKGVWRHLSRQGGGLGLRGGAGETQLEVERRIYGQKISTLKKELSHVQRVRETQRSGRSPSVPRVALVGYTNAGKTSLLKQLTGAGDPQDLLFATLDTTTRRAWLGPDYDEATGKGTGEPKTCLVSDTVGFIRKLPHQLVAAFRSTLSEVRTSDALLVILDASSPDLRDHLKTVTQTLRTIGCEDDFDAQPRILILNQVDKISRPRRLDLARHFPGAIQMSTRDGLGIDELKDWLRELMPGPPKPRDLEWWERGESIPTIFRDAQASFEEAKSF